MATPTNWAFSQGSGINPYELAKIGMVFGDGAVPARKIDHYGLAKMLSENQVTLNAQDGTGRIQYKNIEFRRRNTRDYILSTDTCAKGFLNPKIDTPINMPLFSQTPAILIDEALLAQYNADCLARVGLPESTPPTPAMQDLADRILEAANGIVGDMNLKLFNSLTIGVNRTTGSNGSKTINIENDATVIDLASGITQLGKDLKDNLFGAGNAMVVGSGLWENFFQANYGAALNGGNLAAQSKKFNFFYDTDAASVLGSNQAAVIERDTVKLVEYMRYTGIFAGQKGTSTFGYLMLPIKNDNGTTSKMRFDFQLKYIDCPEDFATIENYGYGVEGNSNILRGYALILSKSYGLAQIPSNAYFPNDQMYGVNGVLRYTMTNT